MDSNEIMAFIRTFGIRKDDGFEETNIETVRGSNCSQPDAREYGGCDVIVSGGLVSNHMLEPR